MVFSDSIFLFVFFPCVLVVYYLLKSKVLLKNTFLLMVSLFFYAWGNPQFLPVIVGIIAINYLAGILISLVKPRKTVARITMLCIVLVNLGTLFHFKYQTFIAENMNHWFGSNFEIKTIVLPIGISFFTFQAMSYVVDVYRGDVQVQKNPLYLGLYIALFPQLIAGPIVRYETIEQQICGRKESGLLFTEGIERFVIGMAKKVLLANNMAIVADLVFASSTGGGYSITVITAWLGAIAYTFQIYFDFSGYSDMAIGLGKMFGFRFEENFNYPYIASSVTEFWHRWHISLSTWFRDYVYIPLGGNRCSQSRHIFNLFAVWLLTGIWHGANWTFIVWGFLYFVVLCIEKYLLKPSGYKHIIAKQGYRAITLVVIILAWVIFRAENISQATIYLKNMFGIGDISFADSTTKMLWKEFGIFFMISALASVPYNFIKERYKENILPAVKSIWMVIIFMFSVFYIINNTYNPFIYFNF